MAIEYLTYDKSRFIKWGEIDLGYSKDTIIHPEFRNVVLTNQKLTYPVSSILEEKFYNIRCKLLKKEIFLDEDLLTQTKELLIPVLVVRVKSSPVKKTLKFYKTKIIEISDYNLSEVAYPEITFQAYITNEGYFVLI
ncbi:MAG: hypothetical protein ACK4F0_08310 [Candidatus Ratteibacteria bacterium]